jgi:hypothetical protein
MQPAISDEGEELADGRQAGEIPERQPCVADLGGDTAHSRGDAQSGSPSRMFQARSGKIISAARMVGRMCQIGCAIRDAIDFTHPLLNSFDRRPQVVSWADADQ